MVWGIRLRVCRGKGSYHYSYPLPDVQGTQAEMKVYKREKLSTPFIRHGVVIDGVTCSGVAVYR